MQKRKSKNIGGKKVPARKKDSHKRINVVQEVLELLKKPNGWKKLDFNKLKEAHVPFTVLKRVLTIEQLYKIGTPINVLLKNYSLKKIVFGNASDALHPLVPFNELRKNGVNAKKLLSLGVPIGPLLIQGKYSKKELLEAGVPESRIDFVTKTIKQSNARFKKQ
jgi:hypothetical protein